MTITQPSTRLEAAAQEYARRGWPVFPCRPGRKEPATPHGFKDAVTDPRQIDGWWASEPSYNIGIATGRGRIAVDVDPASGGYDTVDQLEAEHGALPLTYAVQTGKDGRHLYYATNEPFGNTTAKLGPGIDTRGVGGYVCGAPSVHPNGNVYQVLDDRPLALLPDWVAGLLRSDSDRVPGGRCHRGDEFVLAGPIDDASRASVDRIVGRWLDDLRRTPEGTRNGTLNITACWLGHYVAGGFLTRDWAEAELLAAALTIGLHEPESRRSIGSGLDKGMQEPWYPQNGIARGPQPSRPKKKASFDAVRIGTSTGSELMTMRFPKRMWAVEGIIAPGVTLLFSRPKAGKSYLSLGLTTAVAIGEPALGKYTVAAGDALYLALEDNKPRLQARLLASLDGQVPAGLDRLHVHAVDDGRFPALDEGGDDAIATWCAEVPDPRLVVVDVLQKVRPHSESGSIYRDDYDAISPLSDVAAATGVPIVVIHHSNKSFVDDADPMASVSGTNGIRGAVDNLILLERLPNNLGCLRLQGRDLPDSTIQMAFDPRRETWIVSNADPASAGQEEVLEVLRRFGPMTAPAVAAELDVTYEQARKRLMKMANRGVIATSQVGRTTYYSAS